MFILNTCIFGCCYLTDDDAATCTNSLFWLHFHWIIQNCALVFLIYIANSFHLTNCTYELMNMKKWLLRHETTIMGSEISQKPYNFLIYCFSSRFSVNLGALNIRTKYHYWNDTYKNCQPCIEKARKWSMKSVILLELLKPCLQCVRL